VVVSCLGLGSRAEAAEGLFCDLTVASPAWTGKLSAATLSETRSCFFALSTLRAASCGELDDETPRFIVMCPQELTVDSNDMNSVLAVEVAGQVTPLEPQGLIQDLEVFAVELPVDSLPGNVPAIEALHLNFGGHAQLLERAWDSLGSSRFTLTTPFAGVLERITGSTRMDVYLGEGDNTVILNSSGHPRDFLNQRENEYGEADTDGDGSPDRLEQYNGTDPNVYDHFNSADDDHDDVANWRDDDLDGDGVFNLDDPDADDDGFDDQTEDANWMDSESGGLDPSEEPPPADDGTGTGTGDGSGEGGPEKPDDPEERPNPMDDGFAGFITVRDALASSGDPLPNGESGPFVESVTVGRLWATLPSADGTGGLSFGRGSGLSLIDVPTVDFMSWQIDALAEQ
jgi:hypothetical protein